MKKSNKKLTIKEEKTMELPMRQELQYVGVMKNCSGFGVADAEIKLHICARMTDGTSQGETVAGTAPFRIELFLNSNPYAIPGFTPYRVIENIPLCEDYLNMNTDPEKGEVCEFNCVIGNLPAGMYTARIFDSQIEDPENGVFQGEARIFGVDWIAVQPPKATLEGVVDPGGLPTIVDFHFGETEAYGRVASAGEVNGFELVPVEIELRSKREGGTDPEEFLEPDTTYHFKIVATNEKGQGESQDMTFVTPSYTKAPMVVALPVTKMV